jgi:hypothetical protein
MNGLILLIGESFRVGGQTTRVKGTPESFPFQQVASESVMRFVNLRSEISWKLVINSYTTPYDDLLCSFYSDKLVDQNFHPDVIGYEALYRDSLRRWEELISKQDFILFLRIDLELKDLFVEIFEPSSKILFPSVCFLKDDCHLLENKPRVSDTLLYVPRRFFSVLYEIDVLGHYGWLHLSNHGVEDIGTMLPTFHDSDSAKDWNPLYRIVGRVQELNHYSKGFVLDNLLPKKDDTAIYFNTLVRDLRPDHDYADMIVSYYSSYYLADHYFGDELEVHNNARPAMREMLATKKNLRDCETFDFVKPMQIIQVQINYLKEFIERVLPALEGPIVLFTTQYFLPRISRSPLTDSILNMDKIALWISHDPIYDHPKYMGFPFGINYSLINEYLLEVKRHRNTNKTVNVGHLWCSPACNLDRLALPQLQPCTLGEWNDGVARSRFFLSPTGDRDETYRHYYCIGFGAIPIANVNVLNRCIYGRSMYLAKGWDEMNEMLATQTLPACCVLNQEILMLGWWKRKISERLASL